MPFYAQHIKAARLHLQKSDPVMKRIIKAVGPCKVKAKSDRFRALVSSIVSQQISTAAARTILGRLSDALEECGGISPEGLAGMDVDSLREVGVSRQKATYVLDLASHIESGELALKTLNKLPDEDVIESLTRVKGIGPWTAQIFLMFSLARMDVFPVDDLGLQNAIKKQYPIRGELNKKKILKLAEKWTPYQTIAAWYLWQSLEVDF